jgi:hypothetical protein
MILPRAMQIRQVRHHLTEGRSVLVRTPHSSSNIEDAPRYGPISIKKHRNWRNHEGRPERDTRRNGKPDGGACLLRGAAAVRRPSCGRDRKGEDLLSRCAGLLSLRRDATLDADADRPGGRGGREPARRCHRQQASHQRRSGRLHRCNGGSRFRARRHPRRRASARRVACRSGGARSGGARALQFRPQCHRGNDCRL